MPETAVRDDFQYKSILHMTVRFEEIQLVIMLACKPVDWSRGYASDLPVKMQLNWSLSQFHS